MRCSDANPPHAAFEASRRLLPPHVAGRVTYAVGRAGDRVADALGAGLQLQLHRHASGVAKPELLVTDPPRVGGASRLLSSRLGGGGGRWRATAAGEVGTVALVVLTQAIRWGSV